MAPEALGPQLGPVEDSLRARGYSVRIELGSRARRWVRRAPPGPPTLRVLCVPKIEPGLAEKLRRGIDPEHHGDFQILGFETPRAVVHEVERLCGRRRSSTKPRPTRNVLAQPTLIEQQLHVERRVWRGARAAAILLAAVGAGGAALGASYDDEIRPVAPVIAKHVIEQAIDVPQIRREGTVLSATAPSKPND